MASAGLRSCCSPRKFLRVVEALSEAKKQYIKKIGFGRFMEMECKELHYELIQWLISKYNCEGAYIQLPNSTIPCGFAEIDQVYGLQNTGPDFVLVNEKSKRTKAEYYLKQLEEDLNSLEVGAEFHKKFLIFACATMVAPGGRVEGSRQIWDTLLLSKRSTRYNWAKYLLDTLKESIASFQKGNVKYIGGSIHLLQVVYIGHTRLPNMPIPPYFGNPLLVTDEVVRKRIVLEKTMADSFGHVIRSDAEGDGEKTFRLEENVNEEAEANKEIAKEAGKSEEDKTPAEIEVEAEEDKGKKRTRDADEDPCPTPSILPSFGQFALLLNMCGVNMSVPAVREELIRKLGAYLDLCKAAVESHGRDPLFKDITGTEDGAAPSGQKGSEQSTEDVDGDGIATPSTVGQHDFGSSPPPPSGASSVKAATPLRSRRGKRVKMMAQKVRSPFIPQSIRSFQLTGEERKLGSFILEEGEGRPRK